MNGNGRGGDLKRPASPEFNQDEGLVSPNMQPPNGLNGGARGASRGGGLEAPPPASLPPPTTSTSSSATSNPHTPARKPRPFKLRRKDEDFEAYEREIAGCSGVEEYLTEGDLGVGTFGVVTKATRRGAKQTKVAMKKIIMHNETDGVPITTVREIKILKALSHENIVPVLDMVFEPATVNSKRATMLMVFPYMDHDLSGLLDNEQVSWTIPVIKLYAKQLLKGTAFLHQNNMIHRDLKAANILIDNTGELKIADFGLARTILSGLTRSNPEPKAPEYTNMVVTRWYRPPELFLGFKKYGTSIDIWGIGCILGEMVNKRPIIQGNSDQEQLQKIWHLCGLPTQENFPEWDQHGGCPGEGEAGGLQNQLMVPPPHLWDEVRWTRRIVSDFGRHDGLYADLIDQCLTLDPAKRPTAMGLLSHDFFTSLPPPAKIGTLHKYNASHEASRRNHRNVPAPPILHRNARIPPVFAQQHVPRFDPLRQDVPPPNGDPSQGLPPPSLSHPPPPSNNPHLPPPTQGSQLPIDPQQQQQQQAPLMAYPGQQQSQLYPNQAPGWGGPPPGYAPPGSGPFAGMHVQHQQQQMMYAHQQQAMMNAAQYPHQQAPPYGPGMSSNGRPPPLPGVGLPYEGSYPPGGPPHGPPGMGGGPSRRGGGAGGRKPVHRAQTTSSSAPGLALKPQQHRPFLPGLDEPGFARPPAFRPPPPGGGSGGQGMMASARPPVFRPPPGGGQGGQGMMAQARPGGINGGRK